jgi:hypothetical protein
MLLETRGYVDDDPGYSCALVIPTRSEDWEWAELFLENVNERAEGDKRIAKARVIVRIWVGEEHYDFLYTDAVFPAGEGEGASA